MAGLVSVCVISYGGDRRGESRQEIQCVVTPSRPLEVLSSIKALIEQHVFVVAVRN
jgi:hypothetical protein